MKGKSPPPPGSIFTPQDRNELELHLQTMLKWAEDCNRAKDCGVDVESLKTIRDQVVSQLQAIKSHFMPDKR